MPSTTTPTITFEQAVRQIEDLINERNFADAHRACLELLRFDPENIQLIRLKNKIEKLVKKNNQEAIKDDLEKMAPLWREKRFAEILENLKRLAVYIDDYPDLKKIIVRAEKAYQEQLLEEKKQSYEKEFQNIRTLIGQKRFPEAMRSAEKLRLLNLHDEKIKNLIQELRSAWIQDEIEKNRSLVESEKFEDILLFLRHLQSIDPESKFLEKKIDTTKKRYQKHTLEEKREFIYEGLEKIRTLSQLKKYEKAAQAAQEILRIDPTNRKAEKFYWKAKKKAGTEIENEVVMQMKNAQKRLQEEAGKDPTNIQRI